MTEAELLAAVLALADEADVLAFHAFDGRRCYGAGFPDLVLAGTKRTMLVELKAPHRALRPEQQLWRYRLIACGELYEVWRPADLESGHIERTLQSLSY
jgi:hypothetical protein